MLTKDVDLLVYEPGLFKAWRVAHQQRGKGGDGVLSGTAFSAASGNFMNAGVAAGDVITLTSIDGMIDGCYEVVGVVSATQLTVSVLRADETAAAIPVGAGSNLIWCISTFYPHRYTGEQWLRDRLALTSDDVDALEAVSTRQLRMAMTAAALVLVFEALCQTEDEAEFFVRKKEVYEQAVEMHLATLRLNTADAVRRGDTGQMVRE